MIPDVFLPTAALEIMPKRAVIRTISLCAAADFWSLKSASADAACKQAVDARQSRVLCRLGSLVLRTFLSVLLLARQIR